ncbi:MAG: type IV pili twitching motility protein PilT, partial [Clostridia bacterium]|nr:type IV pili twitching motility protein PilT [Clostridia bacterium]
MKFDLDELLKFAVEKGASDVHITVGVPPIFRMNGQLVKINDIERLMPDDTAKLVESIMDESTFAKYKDRGEVDFS